ncbi:hypothetical protein [Pseudogemmobacter faecipullorum]|uniref:Phage protein n=1 Tax=Pseudogemmobacter faecipullorum TaxID=2755041 RepID=A0ABS8CS75_9RHOB|nr:hypothetical protein [Pseudogemmobacter faecipullorum]MCB5412255.1 hypothetical protein [Pseudogemmobacter faecipullorum]
MAKLTKTIIGVPSGEIYPREIPVGEECPENLLTHARASGALEAEEVKEPVMKTEEPPAKDPGSGDDKKAEDKKGDAAKKDEKAS